MLAWWRGAPSGYIKKVFVVTVAVKGVGDLMWPLEQGVSGDVTAGTRQRDREKIVVISPGGN